MTIIQMLLGRDRGPHVGRIIKQADETRNTGGVIPVAADSELFFSVHANTLYELRFLGAATSTGTSQTNTRARIRCSTSVAHAAIRLTRVFPDIPHGHPTATANVQHSFCYGTAQFNADDRDWNFGTGGGASVNQHVLGFGMIKTSTSGVISLAWGTSAGTGTMTLLAGSWLYLREMEEV